MTDSGRYVRTRRAAWLGVGLVLGLGGGVSWSAYAAGEADSVYRKLEVLAQVLGIVESSYVDTVDATDLIYGAAKGALSSLDDHSAFFTPSEYRGLLDATEGEYVGIGVELEWQQELPQVTSVLEGSAAAHSGLKIGDALARINGEKIEGLSMEAVHQRLRGPVGSRVELEVLRRERDEPWTFTLVRSWVRVAPVTRRELHHGFVYAQVKTFSRRVTAELETLLRHEPRPRGLVLDMRGNPGGLFDEAVSMCDLFLTDGPIVAVIGRGGRVLEHYEAQGRGTEPAYPLAVLIDGASASASEVVAGSLADRGRARLFGARSYGKGSVQSLLDLADGSGLKITVARYATPSGRQIDKHGIEPDEAVTPSGDGKQDPVLEAAVRWLEKTAAKGK